VSTAATAGDLEAQLVYRRAVEATIWGMPAVSMAAVRRSLSRDLDAGYGDVIYFTRPMEPRHEFLTANNQTPYVVTFFDLKAGPMVLEVPAASDEVALFGSAIDSWQVPLADVGPTGEDAGKGGRYLFLPPDHQGEPPDGFIVVGSPTRYVHIALRPITIGSGTLEDAVAYSQQLKAYPLEAAGGPPANRYIDAYPLAWKTLPSFDVRFLELLAEMIDQEPPQAKDAAMIGMLASIGIEPGTPFQPQGERAELLAKAVQDGAAAMNDYFINQAFVAHWPDRHWLATKPENNHGFSFYGDGKLDYDHRAGGSASGRPGHPSGWVTRPSCPPPPTSNASRTPRASCSRATAPIACACPPTSQPATSGPSLPMRSAPTPSSTTLTTGSGCPPTTETT
jgi:hypothetical protein